MSVCNRITDVYICFMLLVFPLFTGFHGYAQLTDSKFVCFAAVTLLWLAALLVCQRRDRSPQAKVRNPEGAAAALAAYALAAVLSAVCSPWLPDTLLGAGRWDGLVTLLLCVAVFFGIRRFAVPNRKHLYALAVSLLVNAVLAILQLLGKNPLHLFPGSLLYYDANVRYTGEFLGTIGNVDLLAGYLCLCVPLFAFAYITDGRQYPLLLPAAAGVFLLLKSGVKSGLVGLAFCCLICIPVLLRSRGRLMRACFAGAAVLLGTAAALLLRFSPEGVTLKLSAAPLAALAATLLLLLFALFLNKRPAQPELPEKRYALVLWGIMLALALCAIAAVYFYNGKSGTLYELSRLLHGELREDFGSSRIRIWRELLQLFPERPLLGGGPGTVAKRLSIEFSRYVSETGNTLRTFVDNAHCVYLTVLSDTGILGLAAYLTAQLCSLRRWYGSRSETGLRPALGCALLAFCAEECFGLNLCIVTPLFWLLWGLLEAKTRSVPDAPAGSSRPEGSE